MKKTLDMREKQVYNIYENKAEYLIFRSHPAAKAGSGKIFCTFGLVPFFMCAFICGKFVTKLIRFFIAKRKIIFGW